MLEFVYRMRNGRLGDFPDPDMTHHHPMYVALCLAFSALGKKMTDLPIDFQIQKLSWANEKFPGPGKRSSIGITPRNSPLPKEE
jgi:hypothetical protein